ncbi:MAG: TldD/PmbA family protein [Pseudomonadota bacterium]
MPQTDREIADHLLTAARNAGAEAADAIVLASQGVHIGVSGRVLEEAESSESREAGLRVLLGARQACVSTSDLSAGALDVLADRAVAIAKEAPEDPTVGLLDPAELSAGIDADLELEDPAQPAAPEALEALALEAEEAALAVAGVSQVEQAHAGREAMDVTLAATNGLMGSYRRTSFSVGASAIAGEGLARERDYAGETRRFIADMPSAASIGTRSGERAVAALNPRKPPGGAVPVLYDERCASSLIGHILSAVNGAQVARGASWLRDAMGSQVLPKGMDLIEDPLMPRGLGSRPFDAEGIGGARRPIIEDGVLERWVLDAATGRKLGLASTGNARRGVTAPPSPGVSNVVLTQGPASRDDLIAEMGRGLIVTSMIGLSISATTGDYSRGASGFWVEGGEIAYPVNELTIAGSLPNMVKSMIAANDADPYRSYQVPSLLVEGLTVGA